MGVLERIYRQTGMHEGQREESQEVRVFRFEENAWFFGQTCI